MLTYIFSNRSHLLWFSLYNKPTRDFTKVRVRVRVRVRVMNHELEVYLTMVAGSDLQAFQGFSLHPRCSYVIG